MKDTKERILLASLELFAQYGYDATSVSRIAEAVGLTKGALYRHFEDKAAILRAILARMEADDAAFAGRFDLPTETSSACLPPACQQGYSHNADSALTGLRRLPAEGLNTDSTLIGRQDSPTTVTSADSAPAERHNPSEGTSEGASGGASPSGTAALLAFARAMFAYWTEDAFASAFRRMLTVSQYTNSEMQALYRQYLSDGPLTYCEGIFRAAGYADARLKALRLFAPMTFLYTLYDGEADHTETLRLAEAHFDEMAQELR